MIKAKRAQNGITPGGNLRDHGAESNIIKGPQINREINCYNEPPSGMMGIDEFQSCAVSRL